IVPIAVDAPWALLAFATTPLAVIAARTVVVARTPLELVGVLIATARLELLTAVLLSAGLWIG
ncbi:MAG: 1,4-dihydroxy-2-naphthoate polyprenyltransferase, partial [Acidimicrobiia bacterium]